MFVRLPRGILTIDRHTNTAFILGFLNLYVHNSLIFHYYKNKRMLRAIYPWSALCDMSPKNLLWAHAHCYSELQRQSLSELVPSTNIVQDPSLIEILTVSLITFLMRYVDDSKIEPDVGQIFTDSCRNRKSEWNWTWDVFLHERQIPD